MNVLRLFSSAALAAALGVFATSASATTVVVPDPGAPFIYFGKGDASVTYDGVTFSTALGNDYLFNVGPQFSGDPAVVSSQQATAGLAGLLITLPYAATSATVDLGTINGSNVSVVLSNGVNFVVSTSASASLYLTSAFNMGGATPFNTIELTSTDAGVNVESITFNGGFNSGVPEPATWLMLIMGVAMIGFAARRRSGGMALAA